MKSIQLSVYWPDDWKSVILTISEYDEILNGKEFVKDGEGYGYEGEIFSDTWWFEDGIDGKVEVTYDDSGTGFSGILSDSVIIKDLL